MKTNLLALALLAGALLATTTSAQRTVPPRGLGDGGIEPSPACIQCSGSLSCKLPGNTAGAGTVPGQHCTATLGPGAHNCTSDCANCTVSGGFCFTDTTRTNTNSDPWFGIGVVAVVGPDGKLVHWQSFTTVKRFTSLKFANGEEVQVWSTNADIEADGHEWLVAVGGLSATAGDAELVSGPSVDGTVHVMAAHVRMSELAAAQDKLTEKLAREVGQQ